jgi:hypothetical protein
VNNETVRLQQQGIADLFNVERSVVSKHLKNIFTTNELQEISVCAKIAHTASDGKVYKTNFYNLDAILSVGYRVNSHNATLFRIRATTILKNYMLKGIAIHQRIENLEQFAVSTNKRLTRTEEQLDFFIQKALPYQEGIFYDGQVFDAYVFISDLVKSAKKIIILIDNYVDETVLALLAKRGIGVGAIIYTHTISAQFQTDLQKHNAQYPPLTIQRTTKIHDRFLMIDDDVYHIGASIKDLGKKLFAFSKMKMKKEKVLSNI